MNEGRTLPAVQRAYLYIVALVAIHMVVLAVANLLRVGAEIAMNAPSGGFTGLPAVIDSAELVVSRRRSVTSIIGLPSMKTT